MAQLQTLQELENRNGMFLEVLKGNERNTPLKNAGMMSIGFPYICHFRSEVESTLTAPIQVDTAATNLQTLHLSSEYLALKRQNFGGVFL